MKQKTIVGWAMISPPHLRGLAASAYSHTKQMIGEVDGTIAEKYGSWSWYSWTLGCWEKTWYFFVDRCSVVVDGAICVVQ
jgi:hypothetical protein